MEAAAWIGQEACEESRCVTVMDELKGGGGSGLVFSAWGSFAFALMWVTFPRYLDTPGDVGPLPSLSRSSFRNRPSSTDTKLKLESSLSSEMYPEVRQGSARCLGVPPTLLDLCRDWMYLARLAPLPKENKKKCGLVINKTFFLYMFRTRNTGYKKY